MSYRIADRTVECRCDPRDNDAISLSAIRPNARRFLECFLGRAPLSGLRRVVTPQRLRGCNSLPPLLCITNGGLEPVCHKGSQGCCDIWGSRGRRFESGQPDREGSHGLAGSF